MARYKVIYEREGCIGAAACVAVKPNSWQLDDENKAILIGGKEKNGRFELEIDENDLELHLEAAQVCPVNVIHIINLETGEQLI